MWNNLLWNIATSAQTPKLPSSDLISNVAVVYSIILDENHPEIVNGNLTISSVGSIQCRLLNNIQNDELIIARPLDGAMTILPTRNQLVYIQKVGGDYVYNQILNGLSPNIASNSNVISNFFPQTQKAESGAKSKQYSNVSSTSIPRSNKTLSQNYDGYGNYFNAESGIHKLKLYEGDTLIESKFGQSIRFSGYNNSDNVFSPSILIRNGESPENRESGDFNVVEENINTDGSIIALSSGEKLLDYKLPTQNKKESFFSYPDELRGNQILLNSDRIVLSAKTQQMIFAAKQDIGFITDGQFSIDTTQGINVTTDKDVFFDTKGATFNIDTNGGKVNLGFKAGDDSTDFALKGNVLLDILREFMEMVGQQIFVTPAGATSPGATNKDKLNTLIQKLNTALSEKVQLK
jgi:hypothetical protein